MRLLVKATQSVLIVLSIMMIVFIVLDGYNPNMNFLRNDITKAMLLFFSLLSLINCVYVTAAVITGRFRTGKKRRKSITHAEG